MLWCYCTPDRIIIWFKSSCWAVQRVKDTERGSIISQCCQGCYCCRDIFFFVSALAALINNLFCCNSISFIPTALQTFSWNGDGGGRSGGFLAVRDGAPANCHSLRPMITLRFGNVTRLMNVIVRQTESSSACLKGLPICGTIASHKQHFWPFSGIDNYITCATSSICIGISMGLQWRLHA